MIHLIGCKQLFFTVDERIKVSMLSKETLINFSRVDKLTSKQIVRTGMYEKFRTTQ